MSYEIGKKLRLRNGGLAVLLEYFAHGEDWGPIYFGRYRGPDEAVWLPGVWAGNGEAQFGAGDDLDIVRERRRRWVYWGRDRATMYESLDELMLAEGIKDPHSFRVRHGDGATEAIQEITEP